MPFTPLHFGPALLFGLLFLSYIDFSTFLLANVIVDIEPFLVLTLKLNYPLHGLFHSFLGGTLLAVFLALIMHQTRGRLSPLVSFFKLEQKTSLNKIMVAAFSGIYIHILLDSRSYTDIRPFYPSTYNPLLTTGVLAGLDSYVFCLWCFFGALVVYIVRLILFWRKSR
jgi:hypothetical protein